MKKLIALLILWTSAGLAAAAGPTYGEHGMALFGGKDGLYAAHLPMFHAPHDYQVVLRLRLADKAQDSALRKRLNGRSALWTLAPEKFDLDRLAPGAAYPLKHFKGDLVLGHFEQGGKTQYAGVDVVVEQVLLFHQLSAQRAQSPTASYIQLGTGAQRFLVKQIDSRPDFDHIVAILAPRKAATLPITVAKHALDEPGAPTLEKALPGAKVIGTVYFSTEDLK
ncbi:MAG: hypothetical protein V4484_24210 [Pseudomonadota bacterium]